LVTEPPQPEHLKRTIFEPGAGPTPSDVGGETETPVSSEDEPGAAAIPLYDNVHVLVPLAVGRDRDDLMAEAKRLRAAGRDALDPFDVPERERMYVLARLFVRGHVRRLRSGGAIRAVGRTFGDGTLVVSEKPFPRFPFRLIKVNWVIDGHDVVDVHDHRVLGARLTRVPIPARRFIWAPGKGDTYDLAYVAANVCAILDIHVPEPVAVSGDVALATHAVLGKNLSEDKREGAARDGMAHLILPFGAHLMPGKHHGVRYWPARDVNEGLYSLLSAASSDVLVPDLKHRWRVKMAYSWGSLLAVLLAVGANQFGGTIATTPGSTVVLRWALGVGVVLFVVSLYCTRKYRQIDS
jgi:hypothetical protein